MRNFSFHNASQKHSDQRSDGPDANNGRRLFEKRNFNSGRNTQQHEPQVRPDRNAVIRRQAFKKLVADTENGFERVAMLCELAENRVRRLFEGQDILEAPLAMHIEMALGLPSGWMDGGADLAIPESVKERLKNGKLEDDEHCDVERIPDFDGAPIMTVDDDIQAAHIFSFDEDQSTSDFSDIIQLEDSSASSPVATGTLVQTEPSDVAPVAQVESGSAATIAQVAAPEVLTENASQHVPETVVQEAGNSPVDSPVAMNAEPVTENVSSLVSIIEDNSPVFPDEYMMGEAVTGDAQSADGIEPVDMSAVEAVQVVQEIAMSGNVVDFSAIRTNQVERAEEVQPASLNKNAASQGDVLATSTAEGIVEHSNPISVIANNNSDDKETAMSENQEVLAQNAADSMPTYLMIKQFFPAVSPFLKERTGISSPTISGILSGNRPITDKNARKIEEALNAPEGWFTKEMTFEEAMSSFQEFGAQLMNIQPPRRGRKPGSLGKKAEIIQVEPVPPVVAMTEKIETAPAAQVVVAPQASNAAAPVVAAAPAPVAVPPTPAVTQIANPLVAAFVQTVTDLAAQDKLDNKKVVELLNVLYS